MAKSTCLDMLDDQGCISGPCLQPCPCLLWGCRVAGHEQVLHSPTSMTAVTRHLPLLWTLHLQGLLEECSSILIWTDMDQFGTSETVQHECTS